MLCGTPSARLREWCLAGRSWFGLACDDLRLVGLKLIFLVVTGAALALGLSRRPVRAQHRVGQLRQLVAAGGQAGMEIPPEPLQHGEWPGTGILWQAVHHGLRLLIMCPLARTNDHAEAALMCPS
jgi:hypothetical protein